MTHKKKLQVFVSSTYKDLKEERQAAVEAILTAGHIPAGMELFAAGDESQMNAIRRWIDESDVFLLILGGRYGSIEPKSQKSYIQLEYEYAIEKSKPLFAVVIEDEHLKKKVKKEGIEIYETENLQKLKEFRVLVTSRLVRFWSEPRDIKLAILETMSDFSRRDDLIGWIPGDESVKSNTLAEEIARLAKENASLREKLANLPSPSIPTLIGGLTVEQMYSLLANEKIQILNPAIRKYVLRARKRLGQDETNLLGLFLAYAEDIERNETPSDGFRVRQMKQLEIFGLVKEYFLGGNKSDFELTEDGRRFFLNLKVKLLPIVIND